MMVITRYRVPTGEGSAFATRAQAALDTLSGRPGFLTGAVGRNVDDESLWSLTTYWENTGSYRRALSNTEVKLTAVPLLSQAIDEPTAYETL